MSVKTLKAFAVIGDGYSNSADELEVASTDGVQMGVFTTIPAATERLEFDGEQVLAVVILAAADFERITAERDALQQRLNAADQRIDDFGTPPVVLPELTEELRYIFGMMCFQCITYAQALRGMGHTIANKAEDEQAATIHWMLGHYLSDPDNWRTNAIAEIKAAKLAAEQL